MMPEFCNPPRQGFGDLEVITLDRWPRHDWVTENVTLVFSKDGVQTIEERRCRRCGDESEVTTPGTARAKELGAVTRADA